MSTACWPRSALWSAGYSDYQGVLAADDYLGYTENANGYGAGLYHVAFVGTPSESGLWSLTPRPSACNTAAIFVALRACGAQVRRGKK
jgi:hypothetical protein